MADWMVKEVAWWKRFNKEHPDKPVAKWITRPVKVGREVVYPTTLIDNEGYFLRRLAKKQYYER